LTRTRRHQPLITQLGEKSYLLTHTAENFTSNCLSNNLTSAGIGAVQIQLPCDCNLKYKGRELITASFPCRQSAVKDIEIQHLLPAAFTKLNTLQLSIPLLNQPQFDSLEQILDQNWTTKLQGIKLPNTFLMTLSP